MTTSCTTNQYFSGQGSLLLETRSVAGAAEGFVPVGNVPELTLAFDTTTFEHKESCTGSRGIDLELIQETSISRYWGHLCRTTE